MIKESLENVDTVKEGSQKEKMGKDYIATTVAASLPTVPDVKNKGKLQKPLASVNNVNTADRVAWCQQCQAYMIKQRPTKKFCSNKCRQLAYVQRKNNQ